MKQDTDTMKKSVIFVLIILALFVSCTEIHVPAEQIMERSLNHQIFPGYNIMPCGGNKFIIIDNDILRARVYYDQYRNVFPDYNSFLQTALSNPESIDYSEVAPKQYSFNDKPLINNSVAFHLLVRFYLTSFDDDSYSLETIPSDIIPFILLQSFLEGYYIYFADQAATWVISKTPPQVPPGFYD